MALFKLYVLESRSSENKICCNMHAWGNCIKLPFTCNKETHTMYKNASQDADSFGTNICVCYNSLNSLTPPQPPSIPPCHI